jgi:tetratricopeptide (TPR) repeat protein
MGTAGETFLIAPFANRTPDPALDWIGESTAETLREAFVAAGVNAVPRDARLEMARKLSLGAGANLSLAANIRVAEQLNAGRIIHGFFETSPEGLKVTARMMDLDRVALDHGVSHSGPVEELPALEVELAWKVLKKTSPAHRLSREEFLRKHPVAKLSALENYVRGLMASSPEQRHRLFTQSARIDPGFSHPCYYLGRMQYEQDNFRAAAGWLEKVSPDNLNWMHATFLLGLSRFELSDWEGARQAFERVERQAPSPEVWNNLGAVLARLNHPEALEHFRKALDARPGDPDYHFNTGYAQWKRGDYTAAAERFRAVLDRSPGDQDSILLLGRCLKQSGPRAGDLRTDGLERLKDAIEEVEKK